MTMNFLENQRQLNVEIDQKEKEHQDKVAFAIQQNQNFRNYCAENFEAAKTDPLVAANILLKIYNNNIRMGKPMKHTVERWLQPEMYERFMKAGIINIWDKKLPTGKTQEEFFIDKEKLKSFITFLENKLTNYRGD